MMNEPATLSGVIAPVLTPFQDDLSPDTARFLRHCRWLLAEGCGLALFGTTGEANSLSVHERLKLLDALADAGVERRRILVGTGTCAVPDSVRLSAHALARGYAGVLMLPPFYYKGVSEEGLFRSFAEVIERVGDPRLRLYLYHIPPIAQVPVPLGLIERLRRAYPAVVVGLKDSSGDWRNTEAVLQAFPDFTVFAGSEAFLLRTLRAGGAGCISATVNINPLAVLALYNGWQAEDADARQRRLDDLRFVLQQYPMIPALKAVLAEGLEDAAWARPRPPLVELSAGERHHLMTALRQQGYSPPVAPVAG